ncbi:MAG TPA: TPM domain-containing protein, partial [Pyrinomonadaceae bacterium]|nr:TPM domain-containing protein [Pyrinomonadaceae bacterium]
MQTRRSHSLAAMLAALFLLAYAGVAHAQLRTQSPLPAPTGHVNDYAGVIDEATKSRLETSLSNLKTRADIEFAVVTVPTTGDLPIFDYSLAVARGWGIGSKEGDKAGLLLLVAINDRKYYLQTSRHLEGDLPDGLVGAIMRERLREPFRAGDYSRGLSDTVQTIVATLAQNRGFSVEGIDQSYAYRGRSTPARGGRGNQAQSSLSLGACCIIAVVALFLISMFSGGKRGGRGGGGGGGCLNALLLANLFSGLGGGGRSSGGWGGGSGWGGG